MTLQPPTDNAQTWRDLVDQLTPSQLELLVGAELRPVTTPAELLEWAHECVQSNATKAALTARLAHVEVPAGATADSWDSIRVDDGDATRSLEWWTFSTASARIAIDGFQDESGAFTRGISIERRREFGDFSELPASEARELARALDRAADALDGMTAR